MRPVFEIVEAMRKCSANKWVKLFLSVLMLVSPLSSLAQINSSLSVAAEGELSSGLMAVKPSCHNQHSESQSEPVTQVGTQHGSTCIGL